MESMKILMINPPDENTVIENPDSHSEDGTFLEADDFGEFPPLGMLYVLSYLEKNTSGHELHFIDCIAQGIRQAAIPKLIEDIRPDVVGITSFTISLVDCCKVAETVRRIVPHAHICLGGHHPIAYPFEAAQLPQFDSIVVGEGEYAFTALVNALEADEDITKILGVYTRESIAEWQDQQFRDKRFLARVSVPPAYVEDVDALPPVSRKWIRHLRYQSILGVTADMATILSSRGCPYLCTFCDVPYKRYRQRSHEKVVDEIEECLAMGYKEFRFYDDLFNITPKKIIEFCDELDRRGLKIEWEFRGRVNTVTYDSLKRAKQSGLRMISFGVETGSDEGLKALKKGTNTEKVRNAFRWCRELGILTVADYIIGLPHERSPADVRANIDFLVGLDPDYAQVSVLKLYPNTEMYDQAVAKGIVAPGRWQGFALNPHRGFVVDHWTEFMDLDTLIGLQKWAYRRFYLRPRYIVRSAFNTRSFYEFYSKAKGAMKILKANRRVA
ncbi:hypothetical protein A6A05_00660 [Magnetospirillum moscoviense]|uniref:Uncharacterized protein n=2 Tax=Magnetospirillum moscoviense TaxID=1437059 RepID=A0A178MYK3_9PROT|nr:hypothetical protein A6A05_00660 [Magnetospirillum moscoviense]